MSETSTKAVRLYGARRVDLHFWGGQCEEQHWSGGAKFQPVPCEKVVLASEHDAAISTLSTRLAQAERDARRYRWWCEHRHVTLITTLFGNGCMNRTLEDADAYVDAALASPPAETREDFSHGERT